jgi:octaprenyl-diphosphate synthase
LEGEWIQDSLIADWQVDLKQLDQVHNLKTASLFKWCLRSPFLCAEIYSDEVHSILEELGGLLGLLFQRSDDLLDFDIRNDEKKAILGDLKSGYLNSFGSFLIQGQKLEVKEKFCACQSMQEIWQVVGHEAFTQKLSHFDDVNREVIQLYEHYVTVLDGLLPADQKSLCQDLRGLPNPLYWRKV